MILLREGKTTKLEEGAAKAYQEAERLANTYEEKISEVQRNALDQFHHQKAKIIEREKLALKSVQVELEKEFQDSQSAFEGEVSKKREQVMAGADGLSNELVQKLIS